MTLNISDIIPVTTRITPGGLGFGNFGSAVAFVGQSDSTSNSFATGFITLNSPSDLPEDFAAGSQAALIVNRWFSVTPRPSSLRLYIYDDSPQLDETTFITLLDTVRNTTFWYWTIINNDLQSDSDVAQAVAAWALANDGFFVHTSVVANVGATATTDDIASLLNGTSNRKVNTFWHTSDTYAGVSEAALLSTINFSVADSVLDTEFKQLSGVAAVDVTADNVAAFKTKNVTYYPRIDSSGQVIQGRVRNSLTHSGEATFEVFAIDGLVNRVQVELFNVLDRAVTKVPQTPRGQQLLINGAELACEAFIANGFLGPRTYIDPDDGEEKVSAGYEILTKPEDVLNLSDVDRDAFRSAPIRIRTFPSGSVRIVDVTINVE